MAGFGFSNSPAFSRDPKLAAQLQQDGAYVPGQTYAPQQGHDQRLSQQQGFQQYGQPQGVQQPGVPTADQLGQMYDRPAATPADTGRLTYDGVIMKTLATLGAVATTFVLQMALFFTGNGTLMQALMLLGLVVGLVLGLVNAFKREPSRALVLAYGAAQGLAIGGFSVVLEYGRIFGPSVNTSGIILQALLGTAAVFAATLTLYAFRIVRVTPKFTRFFFIILIAYALFSVVNLVLMWTGVTSQPFGVRSMEVFGIPLGVALGLLAVALGAYSLMLDFNNVEIGVQRGAPAKYGWQAAFGITATIIWLYVEILRMIAILRGSN